VLDQNWLSAMANLPLRLVQTGRDMQLSCA